MQYLYVCHFSNGHIKVGRSISPKSRIASHADRVGCVGIELIEHYIVECSGHSAPAESVLIECCAGVAKKRNKSEWFEGLDYETVCSWASNCAIDPSNLRTKARNAIWLYLDSLPRGGQRQLAEVLDVQIAQVWQWANEKRPVPVHLVKAIVSATDGAVTEKDLRPDDWHLIWPDLSHLAPASEGA